MKTFLFDTFNRFLRYSEKLDVKTILCNRSWWVFNDNGEKETYLFNENCSIVITKKGQATDGTWQYMPADRSVIIRTDNQELMVVPSFVDGVILSLQVDGTNQYAFLIDEQNKAGFAPKTFSDVIGYFEQKEKMCLEAEKEKEGCLQTEKQCQEAESLSPEEEKRKKKEEESAHEGENTAKSYYKSWHGSDAPIMWGSAIILGLLLLISFLRSDDFSKLFGINQVLYNILTVCLAIFLYYLIKFIIRSFYIPFIQIRKFKSYEIDYKDDASIPYIINYCKHDTAPIIANIFRKKDNKKYSKQEIFWKLKAAEYGDASEMCIIGWCYEIGNGMPKDTEKAVYWFKKGAESGNVRAIIKLGWCYEKGIGVVKDFEKAVYWFKKAAESGEAWAMGHLGWFYENGTGVVKDFEKAAYWFKKAAENGDAMAMNNIASCYRDGIGVSKDIENAVYWFKKAAENGIALAMCNLGYCYENGSGVEKDLEKALYWYRKGAENGEANSMYNLALFYGNGKGVKEDMEKAELLIKAYDFAQDGDSKNAGIYVSRALKS